MEKLLEQYSITDIIIFLVIAALAIKGVIDFFDWASARIKKKYNKENSKEVATQKLEADISCCQLQVRTIMEKMADVDNVQSEILKKINSLVESDKDSMKTIITDKYHVYTKQGWIDDYSLDCLERMFKHYEEAGGNSFVHNLMDQLRELPREELKK